jgi:hypothetical protein
VSGNNDAKDNGDDIKIDATLKAGSGTDAETLIKEEEAINIDGLNAKEVKELRDKVRALLRPQFLRISFRKFLKSN